MRAKNGTRVLAAAGVPLARTGFARIIAGTSVGDMVLCENANRIAPAVGG